MLKMQLNYCYILKKLEAGTGQRQGFEDVGAVRL